MLRRVGPLERLCQALRGVDRLVLLGDVLELRHGPERDALGAAEPVLRAIGEALGEAEVVIVPGNHDHHLLAPWFERRSLLAEPPPLELESPVQWREQEALGRLASHLAPARVRAAYPGVWLGRDVYAMHGHYGDRHTTVPMFERLGAGAMARIAARGRPPVRIEDYEAVLGPMYAWIHALAQGGREAPGESSHGPSSQAWRALRARRGGPVGKLRRVALGAGLRIAVAGLDRAGLGPLRADISSPELRRAGLAACAQVVGRLGIEARQVIFGHTHRAGPLPEDELGEWEAGAGARLINSGCWVHEAAYLGRDPGRSPYRPGFAVEIADGAEPQLRNLLD